ncbi:UNVERIFIED_CONTAM: hypothetical protein DES50_108193 [Williamsia faeni]
MNSYGPGPGDYPQLPGPARFIAQVVDSLNAGNTVIAVFPETSVESGIADAVLGAVHDENHSSEYCHADPDEPFHARVLATFGADPVATRDYDEWESIIRWEPWHGSWVFVSAWDHADVDAIVARWPAQVHASGLPAADRPKLVVGVRLSDVDRGTLDHLDYAHLSVHWWWGVIDSLDTQTRLAAVADRRLNPVDAAVVVELSVWDLACVDFLAAHWDRTTNGLAAAVHAYQQYAPADDSDHLSAADRRPTTAPPAKRQQAWQDGLLEQWGHTTNRSPRILNDAAIRQRLWLAHNRTLIVHVDEERAHYEQLLRRKASHRALATLDQRDDEIIEIGALAHLVVAGWVDIDRVDRDRLYAFRDLRNALAHRTPVDDTLRARVIKYLGFT